MKRWTLALTAVFSSLLFAQPTLQEQADQARIECETSLANLGLENFLVPCDACWSYGALANSWLQHYLTNHLVCIKYIKNN